MTITSNSKVCSTSSCKCFRTTSLSFLNASLLNAGACGGELACSTCHLIFEQDVYETLPEKEDEEDDMLDLAFEVTET